MHEAYNCYTSAQYSGQSVDTVVTEHITLLHIYDYTNIRSNVLVMIQAVTCCVVEVDLSGGTGGDTH